MVTTTVRIPYHLQSHLLTVFLDKLKDLGRAMFSNTHISGGDQISNEHGSSFDSVAQDGMLLFPAQLASLVSCHIVCYPKNNGNNVSRLLTEDNSKQALSISTLNSTIPCYCAR
jgi:hypothetical protein